jgi:hypothetical protein
VATSLKKEHRFLDTPEYHAPPSGGASFDAPWAWFGIGRIFSLSFFSSLQTQ